MANVRCEPIDPISKFMFKNKDAGVTSHILSFLGEKRGYGDLRGGSTERFLEVALVLGVLRKESNVFCRLLWEVKVDEEGEVIDVDDEGEPVAVDEEEESVP